MGAGLSMNNLDVKALRAIFELLQGHYPERLSELWFLNAPWIFWGKILAPPRAHQHHPCRTFSARPLDSKLRLVWT